MKGKKNRDILLFTKVGRILTREGRGDEEADIGSNHLPKKHTQQKN